MFRFALRRWDKYFASDGGAETLRNGVFISIGIGTLYFGREMVFPHKLSDWFSQLYENETKVPIPEHLEQLADQEYAKSGAFVPAALSAVSKRPRRVARFYVAKSFEPVCRGTSKLPTIAASIGIPYYFTFETPEDVRRGFGKIGLTSDNAWQDSEPGLSFQDSAVENQLVSALLLSPEAKQFALQKCLQECNSMLCAAFAPSAFLALGCSAAVLIMLVNNKMNLMRRSRWIRYAFYSLVWGSVGVNYGNIAKTWQIHVDRFGDAKSGAFGENYAKGGIEYYEKLLKRNRVLRRMLGSDGANYYTPVGDYVRPKRLSLLQHLEDMRKLLPESSS